MTTSRLAPTAPERRSWPARLAWLGVLALGIASYLVMVQTMVATQNLTFFPSLILIGSVTVPIAVLVFAWGSGPFIQTPPSLVVITALAGGIVGTIAAGTLEYDTGKALGALPMILVGLIEEACKLIVPIVIMIVLAGRGRLGTASGVTIGVASGMGFATLETMGYGFAALLQAKSLAALDQTLLLRALLSPAGHVAWTGMTTWALWRIPTAPRQGRAITLAVGAFILAVGLHSAWDGLNSVLAHAIIGVVSVALLLTLIIRSHHEHHHAPRHPDHDRRETERYARHP